MRPGSSLANARRRAGLSQRELASRTGIAQPTIARIERDREDPRFATLSRLLRACDAELALVPAGGTGIDRTEIRELLALSPAQRVAMLVEEAGVLDRLARARRID